MDSILTSVKKAMSGITEKQTDFDPEIIMFINSVFFDLWQVGVGPEKGFSIDADDTTWDEYMDESPILNAVKTYVTNKVRRQFDPPTNSTHMESLNRLIAEAEWRLGIAADK